MTSTLRLVPEYQPVSPSVCAPWCTHGDGHPNEFCPEDQVCWGDAMYIMLEREPGDVGFAGEPYPARMGVMARKAPDREPVVYLHVELPKLNIDVDAGLTAEEARALAAALTQVADTITFASVEATR